MIDKKKISTLNMIVKERKWNTLLDALPAGEEVVLTFPDHKAIDSLSTICYRVNSRSTNVKYRVNSPKKLRMELKACICKEEIPRTSLVKRLFKFV